MNTLRHSSPVLSAGVPTAERLLAQVLSAWRRVTLLRGVLTAVAVLVALAATLVLTDVVYPLPAAARNVLRFLPVVASLGWLAWTAARTMRAPAARRLALLAEERLSLDNRLVTALELPREGRLSAAFRADTERRLADFDGRSVVPLHPGAAGAILLAGTGVLALGTALFPGTMREAWNRWLHPADSFESAWADLRADVLPGTAAASSAAFGELRWTIEPPAYTGLPVQEERGASLLTVLPGSRLRVRSYFPAAWSSVRAEVVGGRGLRVRRSGDEWSVEWTFRPDDRGVAFQAMTHGEPASRRVVALAPATDQPPVVELVRPDTDMVLATASGRVPIRATARDDYGVGNLALTWIRSRGSGESFSFEEGTLEWDRLSREGRTRRAEHSLDLAAMDLRPGDVLHVRAIARDRNTATGPGEGVSETRVIRIALPDEMHTATTLIGYPLQGELNPLLSQRMLILMTEDLRDRANQLEREAFVDEANHIADEQGRLRARVGEQVYTRSVGGIQSPGMTGGFEDIGGAGAHQHEGEAAGPGAAMAPDPAEVLEEASGATGTGSMEEQAHVHDEAPIVDVNRDRITIYNAMWAAERALRQGSPVDALPHQYEALRMLQEARAAERVYVRGQTEVPTVDVAGVRGSGEIEEADPAARTPTDPLAASAEWMPDLERLAAAIDRASPADLAADLAALSVRMLADPEADPRGGALVSRAADAVERGERDEARRLLAAARALVAPRANGGDGVPLPVPADPVAADYFRRLGGGR